MFDNIPTNRVQFQSVQSPLPLEMSLSSSSLLLLNEISILGGTLEQHVAKGPVPEKTCSAFGKDLLQALKFLHETVGFLHRDIHGNSFPRNHLRLEMMITLQMRLFFLLLVAIHKYCQMLVAVLSFNACLFGSCRAKCPPRWRSHPR